MFPRNYSIHAFQEPFFKPPIELNFIILDKNDIIKDGDYFWQDGNGWRLITNEDYFGETVESAHQYRGYADWYARKNYFKIGPILNSDLILRLLDK